MTTMTTIDKTELQEEQTDSTAQMLWVKREFAEHPSKKITPQRLARIFERAETGDIVEQCDLFADMEERDGHICAEIGKRKRALLGLKWEIEPPKNATAQEKTLAQNVADIFESIADFEDVILSLADGIGYGFACLELEWQLIKNVWQPVELKARPHRWFQLSMFDRNDIKLRDGSSDGAQLWQAGWLVHKHKAKTGDVASMGLHRALAFPFLFKNYALNDYAEFLEIYGLPLVLGKYDVGESKEAQAKLLRAVSEIGHHARGIIPKSQGIEFLEAATKGTGEPFKTMIEWCENTVSKVILGGTLTSQSTGGTSTNALGNVHNEVRHDILKSDAMQIASSLTRLCGLICEVNGWQGRVPKFVFDLNAAEDFALFADAMPKLAAAGLEVPVSYLYEKLKIPMPKDGEPVLESKGEKSFAPTSSLTALSSEIAPPKFTPDQQVIEDLADNVLAKLSSPISNESIFNAIRAAKDYDDLADRLAVLFVETDTTEFRSVLERATFAADLMGYANNV